MFNPDKYLGTWYQIAHYPSWFEGSATYNTTAKYKKKNGKIAVKNTTNSAGTELVAKGTAVYLGHRSFNVSFPPQMETDEANYIIVKLWTNRSGSYQYSVVTNKDKSVLFVLSRTRNPPTSDVNKIFEYLSEHFKVPQIVMTPHYP